MKKAVFFHCKFSGTGIPSEDQALNIYTEQVAALQGSGLADETDEIHFGVNGPDALLAGSLAPTRTHIHALGCDVEGERPTMSLMQQWLPEHPDWAVLYFHMKGVSQPNDAYARWRRCMERAVIWNWRRCVDLMIQGFDTVGAHWLTHAKYPILGKDQRYWGGTFWWAAAKYLLTLPPLPEQRGKYYKGEEWIGTGIRAPLLYDFCPHFPMTGC